MNSIISFQKFLSLTESQSDLVKDLVTNFGSELVFERRDFVPKLDQLFVMYSILNQHVFESKLSKLPIWFEPYEVIDAEYLKRTKQQEHFPEDAVAVHLIDELHDDIKKVSHPSQYRFGNELIAINKTYVSQSSLGTMLGILCHEMIHSYDVWHGVHNKILYKQVITGQKQNFDRTSTFRSMMRKANDLGIDVRETIKDNETIEDLDDAAIAKLQAIQESEEFKKNQTNTIESSGDITIVPGSHTTIAHI